MRTPLCSTPLNPEGLWHLRQAVRTAGDRLALAPLLQARWLTAVSTAARAAMRAGGSGTVTLALDTDSPRCGGPALAAQLPLPFAADAAAAQDWQPGSPALADLVGLVDHLGLEAADNGTALLALEIAVAGGAAAGWPEETLPEPVGTLPQQPPAFLESIAQQDEEMAAVLAAVQAEREASLRAQADTLNTLAHDIRSPLLTLNLSLEMLRIKPHGPPELKDRCEVMKRQLDELKALAARARQHALSLSSPPTAHGELPPPL